MKQSRLDIPEHRTRILTTLITLVVTLITPLGTTGFGYSSVGASHWEPHTTSQEFKQDEILELTRGARMERGLQGGEAHAYRVMAASGQFMSVVVDQKGIDVVVALFGPNNERLTEVDSPNGMWGPELVSVISEAAGQYRLEVRAANEKDNPGRYEIRVEALREATGADRDWIATERALAEAGRLRTKGTKESLGKALEKYNQALVMLRTLKGRWETQLLRVTEAQTLNVIGDIYSYLGENQKSLEYFNQALTLRHGMGDRGEAETLHNIGHAYYVFGENQKALEYFEQALVLERAIGDRSYEANTLLAIAAIYRLLGEQQKALECLHQALLLKRAVGDRSVQAEILIHLGLNYWQAGEFQTALDYLNQALLVGREMRNKLDEAFALDVIGRVHNSLGEQEKALDCFNQSLLLRRGLGERLGESIALSHLGATYSLLGKQAEALSCLEQALSLARAVGAPVAEANTLHSIAVVYKELGDVQKTLEYLKQTLVLQRAIGERVGEAMTLSDLGAVYSSLGKPDEALSNLQQALPRHRAVGDRWSEAETLQRLARVEADRGRFDEARTHIETALDIVESIRNKLVGQQLRTSFSASRQDYYELYIDLLMRMHRRTPFAGHDAAALQVNERARARSLLEILNEAHADIRQGVDPELLERERRLQTQINAKAERLMRLLNGEHTGEQESEVRKELEDYLTDYQDIQAQIRARSPRYAALTQPRAISLKQIQQQVVDEDTLLLEYALGEVRSYLFVVTSTSIRTYILPKKADIESAARRVHDLLVSKADGLFPEPLATLSQTLLGPVADQLPNRRIIIVSDGALQYVPFAALPKPTFIQGQSTQHKNGNKKPYEPLVLGHEIISLPSASVLALQRRELLERVTAPKKLMVFADPVFDKDDRRVTGRVKRRVVGGVSEVKETTHGLLASDIERSASDLSIGKFERLQVSRREAELITAAISKEKSRKALDFAASRATAKSPELSQYQIVHFATHSLLNNQHPELSGIVLSLVDQQGQPQDGFLRLHEIYNLKFAADLVVLSACETALGKQIRGEGLVGLTRGFMYAGTPRVVASLWKVSDNATAELMKRFYENMLGKGMRPAEALRAAQVSMLKDKQWAAPYYWAGFVFQGEWR